MRSTLAWHLKYIHGKVEKTFQCSKCGHITTTEDALKQHMESSHAEGVKCNQCSFMAKTQEDLKAHLRAAHDAGRLFQCWSCTFAAEKGEELGSHLKDVHNVQLHGPNSRNVHAPNIKSTCIDEKHVDKSQENHTTDTRELGTQSSENLDTQIESEDDDDFIKEETVSESELDSAHQPDPLKCEVCSYTAPSQAALAWHTKTNHTVRRYEFGLKMGQYRNHSNHTQAVAVDLSKKNFKCWMCHFSASEREALRNHISKQHAFKT